MKQYVMRRMGVLETMSAAIVFGLMIAAGSASAQVNVLTNPGFELAEPNLGWAGISNWYSSAYPDGGDVITVTDAHQGTNVMRMFAYGVGTHILTQAVSVVAGEIYEADGWLRTPPGTSRFTPTNGYAAVAITFANASGGRVGTTCESSRFGANAPTNWTRYTTGPCQAPVGAVKAKITCQYSGGTDATTNGFVYFDDMRAFTSQVGRAGALMNPDFETQPAGTLTNVPCWMPFGVANNGIVATNYSRGGRFSLKLGYTETLLGQAWAATAGVRYATSGYMLSPTGDRFASTTNCHGVILLQYLDAAGNLLGNSFEIPYFYPTSPADSWISFEASGVAPAGTASGRTMCAILGAGDGYAGSIYFDDMSQSSMAATSTQAGLIYNPGFDDGLTGDAFFLSNNLPRWTWYGGSNAGFVVNSASQAGGQSLAIVYKNNLAGQDFAAVTGRTYTVEGYMMTPAADKMTSTTAYATFLLEFFTAQGGATSVSVVGSVPLTRNTASDTWIKFGVTNRAPWTGSAITGRVSCALLDLVGTPYGGTVYFDSVKVTETTVAVANTQSGMLWNPGFEYSPDGTKFSWLDSWTGLGLAGNVDSAYVRTGDHSLKIYSPQTLAAQTWSATQGWKYASSAYVLTPSSDRLAGVPALHGVVLLQFLNATNGVLANYESSYFTTNHAPDAWTNLVAMGVAPAGTVYGRTVIGLLGTNTGFGGSIYFDDISQWVISTTGTMSGLLRNPGFEDGPLGNAYDLDRTNDLAGWKWFGGNSAGYITRDRKAEGLQSLVLTYAQNYMVQDFAIARGSSGANLLANPGFEIGPAGGATPAGWWKFGELGQELWAPETGTNGVAFWSWVNGNWGFMGQDVGVDNSMGNVYTFSIRGHAQTNFTSSGSEAYLKLEFWVNGEGAARYVVTNNVYGALRANRGFWGSYSLTVTNSDAQVNLVKPVFGYGQASDIGGDMAVKWDNASLTQTNDANAFRRFVATGYLMTPSSAKFSTDGTSHGELQLSFFCNGDTNPAAEFTAVSAPFGGERPADTWLYFAVTGTAPAAAICTGRLSCVIQSSGGDSELGGVIYYDQLSVVEVGSQTPSSSFELWQLQNFGRTDGANVVPQDDYDGDLFVNWSEFIAGTQPTNNGSLLESQGESPRGGGYVIRWPSVAGRTYTIRRWTNIVSGASMVLDSHIAATVPVNAYTDAPPSSVAAYYYRVSATTNQP